MKALWRSKTSTAHFCKSLIYSVARGVLRATQRTVLARFLSMLSVVAVFVPSFLMSGVAQNLFVPLSLAVAFAMIASFLLSSSLLPVLFLWTHRQIDRSHKALIAGRWDFDKVRDRWGTFLERLGIDSLALGRSLRRLSCC